MLPFEPKASLFLERERLVEGIHCVHELNGFERLGRRRHSGYHELPIIARAGASSAVALPRCRALGPEQSTAVREQLLADIGQLQSPDEAADWVHKNLPLKNALTAADADLVEAVSARSSRVPFLSSSSDDTCSTIIVRGLATSDNDSVQVGSSEHGDVDRRQSSSAIGRGSMPTPAHHEASSP